MNEKPTTIVAADLMRPDHQDATVQLLNAYALDPMGDGQPLSETARHDLIPGLQQHPTTIVFLAYRNAAPVGLAICFRGFSTFAARPLINVSDFFVLPQHRGQGTGRLLLAAIEQHARQTGCCKLTLEVQEHNHQAQQIYTSAGFAQAIHGVGHFFFPSRSNRDQAGVRGCSRKLGLEEVSVTCQSRFPFAPRIIFPQLFEPCFLQVQVAEQTRLPTLAILPS